MNPNVFTNIKPTRALVYLGKKQIEFFSLRLEQAFGEHHFFSLKADFDSLGQPFMANPMEHLKLIGQTIDIEIQQGDENSKAYMFRGLIQNIAIEGSEGKHGYLVISGASPTILMEKGKRYDVFTNLTLKQVFHQLTEDIDNQKQALPIVNAPAYTGQVQFLMQYNESDWEFLRRLSSISKENMYYTGRDLVFGDHKDFLTQEVTYDREITSFQFGNRYIANNSTRYQYLSDKDDTLTREAPKTIKGGNNYVNTAHENAKVITEKRPVLLPIDLRVSDVGAMDELGEREKVGRASQTVYIKGVSKTADPRIGRLLKINMPNTMDGATDLGTYRITKVVHEFNQNIRYECHFEGIPADLKSYPLLDVKVPTAESIRGTVISNEDPDGLGRVRVDFPFASDRVSDAWLRVMTPNAGSSSEVEKNRGMVFIPEKDDQVMVGFEFGDPNRPYVMGSMFHGKNSEGGGANNAIKSIITKSGIKIVFNDNEKSLHIEDPSGNTWDMDGKGNIAVNASETFSVTAKNINLDASENLSGHAGQNVDMYADNNIGVIAGEDYQLSATNIHTQASSDSMHNAEKYEATAQKVRIDSTSENLELASSAEVDVQSAKKVKLF